LPAANAPCTKGALRAVLAAAAAAVFKTVRLVKFDMTPPYSRYGLLWLCPPTGGMRGVYRSHAKKH
jgi:hypothetical protein